MLADWQVYATTKLKEVMIAVITEDGDLEISWTESLSYIQRLGDA